MQKLSTYIMHPYFTMDVLLKSTAPHWPDKLYLSLLYRVHFHKRLNWKKPKTFNEKLNWEKIYNRQDLYTTLADKYAVKKYVADCVGQEYVVENYGVFERWDDIDFSQMPNQFVIKGTHDSGGAFVCKDKATFDFEGVRKKVEHNLGRSFFYHLREWPYKNIKPRIIIDKFLDDHTGNELRDYKFWCFNGKPTFMYCTIKGDNVYENFYDMDFREIDINHDFPRHKPEFEKPSQFELMKELAAKLSKDIPFVRVDFFQVEEKVYFGEFTFYDWGGMRPFSDIKTDEMLGDLMVLPAIKN